MSARGDDPEVPEPEPEPDGTSTPVPSDAGEDSDTSGRDSEADEPNGATVADASDDTGKSSGRSPSRRRRWTRITVIGSILLILALVVSLAVPATRNGLLDLWCDVTGGVCPGEELPPITEDEETRWRVRMEPEEAALWGNYVALGDSYSSGDGAGDYLPSTAEPGGCWRSENAYPKLIAEEFDFSGSLAFYACSSRKGSDMLSQLGTPESQIERVTENTSLVTLGVGGNDLGFTPVLRTCIVRMPLLESSACVEQEDELEKRLEKFEETLAEILDEVHARAPDARVLVLGYPRLFPEEPPSMYYTLTTSDQIWLNSLAEQLNTLIRDVVYQTDGDVYGDRETGSIEYVNTFSALNGYEVSAEEAWLNGIVLGQLGEGLQVDRASFHPTAQGHMSIAARVRLQIEEGPERVLYVSRETLDNVDPEQLLSELGGPLAPERSPDASANEADAP